MQLNPFTNLVKDFEDLITQGKIKRAINLSKDLTK